MKTITKEILTFGEVSRLRISDFWLILDTEDVDRIAQFSWHSNKEKTKYKTAVRAPRKRIGESGPKIRAAYEVLGIKPETGKVIDHINGNPMDNRKCNLRICSQAQNQHNRRKTKGVCSSKFKGVYWAQHVQKWIAKIKAEGKSRHLGCFETERDAATAYDRAALKYFGEYAYLNIMSPEWRSAA